MASLIEVELDALRDENTLLRALLAWGNDPCAYCGLQSSDMSRCLRGFPGCFRSDDMQLRTDKRGWARWTGTERRSVAEPDRWGRDKPPLAKP